MSRRLLVLAGAAALLLTGCGDAERAAPPPTRSGVEAPACDRGAPLRVDARVGVGSGVGALAIDGDTLWAARPRAGAIVPVRVDAEPRAGAPLHVGGAPVSLATGLGGVYVADRDGDRIVRVVPASGAVLLLAGVDAPVKVVLADARLYAISLDDGAVYTMNPRVPGGPPGVAIPLLAPVDAVLEGGELWILSAEDHGVAPFRLRANSFVRGALQMPGPIGSIAAGQGAVWVALPTLESIGRIESATESFSILHTSGGVRPSAVAVDDCAVWVGDAGGRVQRLDPAGARAVGPPIRIGRSLAALVADRGGVWASDPLSGTVVRVAARR